jgi:hypothetical protein
MTDSISLEDDGWISVNDELPEHQNDVECYADGETGVAHLNGSGEFSDGKWILYVTHWKEL